MSKYSLSSLLINKILTILSMHVSAALEATGLYERRTANSFYPYPGASILQGKQLGDFTPLLAHIKPFCRLCTLQHGSCLLQRRARFAPQKFTEDPSPSLIPVREMPCAMGMAPVWCS